MINDKFILGKAVYTVPKRFFPNIKSAKELFYLVSFKIKKILSFLDV